MFNRNLIVAVAASAAALALAACQPAAEDSAESTEGAMAPAEGDEMAPAADGAMAPAEKPAA
jgi:ABC-type oligopeptide transport system substrate-binding subunit